VCVWAIAGLLNLCGYPTPATCTLQPSVCLTARDPDCFTALCTCIIIPSPLRSNTCMHMHMPMCMCTDTCDLPTCFHVQAEVLHDHDITPSRVTEAHMLQAQLPNTLGRLLSGRAIICTGAQTTDVCTQHRDEMPVQYMPKPAVTFDNLPSPPWQATHARRDHLARWARCAGIPKCRYSKDQAS
jgi:hypothetical protein